MTEITRAARRTRKTTPVAPPAPPTPTTKLDQLTALLMREGGATIAELTRATGWQQHSVRGALAGALRKRGLAITSSKDDGVRRYAASRAA